MILLGGFFNCKNILHKIIVFTMTTTLNTLYSENTMVLSTRRGFLMHACIFQNTNKLVARNKRNIHKLIVGLMLLAMSYIITFAFMTVFVFHLFFKVKPASLFFSLKSIKRFAHVFKIFPITFRLLFEISGRSIHETQPGHRDH